MTEFSGQATIRVRFRSKADYQKFRKYILKTEWSYDVEYPAWEELTLEFHNSDDVDRISRNVVNLLQMGFEVNCCKFMLEQHLAEDEYPTEEDPDIKDIISLAWKEYRKKAI